MLSAKGRDPKVAARNRLSDAFWFQADGRVVLCSIFSRNQQRVTNCIWARDYGHTHTVLSGLIQDLPLPSRVDRESTRESSVRSRRVANNLAVELAS